MSSLLRRRLQNKFLSTLLLCLLAGGLTSYPAQQKPSAPMARSTNGISKKPDSSIEIRFDYYPPVGEIEPSGSGLVFVSIHEDGEAKVIRYGPYFKTDSVRVYQGILSRQVTSQLITRIRKALSEWSPKRVYDDGFQDENIFHLAVAPKNSLPIEIKYSGLLGTSSEVMSVVDELRMLWKRLDEVPAAYAYVRSKPIIQQFQDVGPIKNAHHISVQKFPQQLRHRITNAINGPLAFHALTRSQVKQLLVVTSNQYQFAVERKGLSHGLTLYVPQKEPRK